jgi:hypothetical protein
MYWVADCRLYGPWKAKMDRKKADKSKDVALGDDEFDIDFDIDMVDE